MYLKKTFIILLVVGPGRRHIYFFYVVSQNNPSQKIKFRTSTKTKKDAPEKIKNYGRFEQNSYPVYRPT